MTRLSQHISLAAPPAIPPIRAEDVELLAPAGDRDCLRAAVENGADAVYFGLETGFNARARATNFAVDDLPELMAFLHRRGVRGYVTVNTLVFPSELAALEDILRSIAAAGVDAVLVQDMGVARLVHQICPDLPIHASTQMTLSSAECIRFAQSLGIERVVLPRELSINEIGAIHLRSDMQLEAFVHGALCVAYSGQCLTSESLGGRSANRGQCAQACRMTYELICDDKLIDLGEQKYLLSPQDLAAYDLAPQLLAAGVRSFKIEGRLKSAEYVANITRHYRQAIDGAIAGRPVEFTPRQVEEMELSFSRGFSHGWLDGCNHKTLVPALSSAKRGVLLGQVVSVGGGRAGVQLRAEIKPGDGVVFAGDRMADDEQGGRVYEVFRQGRSLHEPVAEGTIDLAFAHGSIDFSRLWVGQEIWKTDDPQLTQRLRKTFNSADPLRKLPVDLTIEAAVGQPLRVLARTASGATCEAVSPDGLEAARKHPLTAELLREQFGRLGGTAYELRALDAHIDGAPMMPLSLLGKLRHELVRQLDEATARPPSRRIAAQSVLTQLRAEISWRESAAAQSEPTLHVLCRSLAQLADALSDGARDTYVDFQDIREYRPAVALAREHGATILLATPRIQKPDEMGIFQMMAKKGADGILVRNLSGLLFFSELEIPTVADFSLNATNELTVDLLLSRGARRVTASYDLNRDQLEDLVAATSPRSLEIVVHQHMPMFHMEHCVFCAVLSPGTNKHNCGRPCDVHDVRLRDRIGMEHPLRADVGCRNTLFNAVPQSAAEAVPRLLAQGIRHFRVELLHDRSDIPPGRVIELYRRLLSGQISAREVWTELQAANRVGVTRGTMEERRNPLAIL